MFPIYGRNNIEERLGILAPLPLRLCDQFNLSISFFGVLERDFIFVGARFGSILAVKRDVIDLLPVIASPWTRCTCSTFITISK